MKVVFDVANSVDLLFKHSFSVTGCDFTVRGVALIIWSVLYASGYHFMSCAGSRLLLLTLDGLKQFLIK